MSAPTPFTIILPFMSNQLSPKEKLQAKLNEIQQLKGDGSPVTNLQIEKTISAEIEQLITELERVNPHPQPIRYAAALLEGAWILHYSTAREIRTLVSLPLGLQLGKVYQVIDVANKLFFNLAQVQHPWGLVSGYVKVTARFEPVIEETTGQADKRINVYFDKRYFTVEKILGIDTRQLKPFIVKVTNNLEDRIPSLDITYLDETLRIGRGGDGSLFILSKSNDFNYH